MAAEPDTEPTSEAPVSEGATGSAPYGESPLSVDSQEDPFAERPEAYVGAAFAGGLVLALIMRRLAR